MGISTISFSQANIYRDKMFFTLYGKNAVSTKVLDRNGNLFLSRISYNPVKTTRGDYTVITRKKEYEFPDRNIIFEIIERIYDKAGKLINSEKHTVKR